jgi:hypothetical protein
MGVVHRVVQLTRRRASPQVAFSAASRMCGPWVIMCTALLQQGYSRFKDKRGLSAQPPSAFAQDTCSNARSLLMRVLHLIAGTCNIRSVFGARGIVTR